MASVTTKGNMIWRSRNKTSRTAICSNITTLRLEAVNSAINACINCKKKPQILFLSSHLKYLNPRWIRYSVLLPAVQGAYDYTTIFHLILLEPHNTRTNKCSHSRG